MATIVVGGALANKPWNGGEAWTRLSWILGFRRLGFDVLFVEEISRAQCVDASGNAASVDDSANLAYFADIVARFGLTNAAALVADGGAEIYGMARHDLLDRIASADLLVNISGHLTWAPLLRIRRKAFVDLDPGFTQLWHSSGCKGARLDGHDLYFTVGENVGTCCCPLPTAGIAWRPVRQPVVLDEWPECVEGDPSRFTTVSSWRGAYGRVELGGVRFGLKAHEFRRFVDLPEPGSRKFEIALDIHAADEHDRKRLIERGWTVVDPKVVAADPWTFRRYVQTSGAEWSVAQGVYVQARTGWFSDRTVRYLASGKPALVQDTGFSRIPAGEGLLTFSTMEEARTGAARIERDYDAHSKAARAIAEEWFASDKVLSGFIDQTGIAG